MCIIKAEVFGIEEYEGMVKRHINLSVKNQEKGNQRML